MIILIDNTINKHGIDAFDYEIIEELNPIQEVLDERKIYWIKKYNSFFNPNHYNLESGGVKDVKIDLDMNKIKKQYFHIYYNGIGLLLYLIFSLLSMNFSLNPNSFKIHNSISNFNLKFNANNFSMSFSKSEFSS